MPGPKAVLKCRTAVDDLIDLDPAPSPSGSAAAAGRGIPSASTSGAGGSSSIVTSTVWVFPSR